MWQALAGFIICTALIVVSGIRLTYHGNRISELTGLSKAWIGLILMASITSLPELVNGISAVAVVKAPDLAAGDIFGSCVFNLLILSLLDARIRKPLTSLVERSHVVAGFFSLILLTVSGVAILTAEKTPVFFWVSAFTPVIFVVYLATIYAIYRFGRSGKVMPERETTAISGGKPPSLRRSLIVYGLNALVVLVAALFLPYFGEELAAWYGISDTFFGTLFLAAATSLPELVVSIAAVRLMAYDMVVGNLLGSNIFNILILGIDDLFYTGGSLYAAISKAHMESVMATVVMTAVVGLGIMIRPQRKVWLFGLDSVVIICIYLVLMYYLAI